MASNGSSRTILLEFKRTTLGQATCKSQNLLQEEEGEKEEKTMPFVSNHMEEVGVSSFRENKCKGLWLLLEKDRKKIKTKLSFSGLERET